MSVEDYIEKYRRDAEMYAKYSEYYLTNPNPVTYRQWLVARHSDNSLG